MNYEHLPDPVDEAFAEECVGQINPHLPSHADVVATKQKNRSTAVFVRSDPSLSDGAIDRLVVSLQEHPMFMELFHFTQGRKMVVYFWTPELIGAK